MTGTDQPTVVRNPKVKVKIKSAPQQTFASLKFTTARKPLTNPSSPAQAGHLARAEVHGRTGHLDGFCRPMYPECMSKVILLTLLLDTALFVFAAVTGAEKLAAVAAIGMFGGAIYLNRWASAQDEEDEQR